MKLERPWWRRLLRSKLSCAEIGTVLQGYLDGELDPADMPAIQQHLDACRDCGLEADMFDRIKSSLTSHRLHTDTGALARLQAFANELVEDGEKS